MGKHILWFLIGTCVFGALLVLTLSADDETQEQVRKEFAKTASFSKGTVVIEGTAFDVNIADDSKLRSIGLQFAATAKPAMLLLWDQPDNHSIWMKYTDIPLSAAFIDESWRIVKIADLVPHSLEKISAGERVIAILEVPAGAFSGTGISVGSKVIKQ